MSQRRDYAHGDYGHLTVIMVTLYHNTQIMVKVMLQNYNDKHSDATVQA